MSRPVAVLFCPGRGAYGRGELGFLGGQNGEAEATEVLRLADAARAGDGRPTLSELDGAEKFRPGIHLDGENAAELIYFGTMLQLGSLRERYRIVAVAGNSMGWYTALPAAGALTIADGWRLVTTMARLQKRVSGGQVLTTAVDADWRPDPGLQRAVDEALAATTVQGPEHFAARSIRLGGHEVLAGTDAAVQDLLAYLPKVTVGEREFPFRLAGHGPFHTTLCTDVAARARHELRDLAIREPSVHLIDGRGNVFSPWSANPAELLAHTTISQVVNTFDFAAAVRTAIREFNPDVLLCAGPGSSLRAPVGHVVVREGYRGIRDRAALFASGLVAVE